MTANNLGNYVLAEHIENRALSILEKSLGPEHPEIAAVLSDLGRICFYQGRNAEAESLYGRALSIAEKTAGGDDLNTGTILNNLAALYRSQGN
jgi:tetratricopeptide (TPR) repeat protein